MRRVAEEFVPHAEHGLAFDPLAQFRRRLSRHEPVDRAEAARAARDAEQRRGELSPRGVLGERPTRLRHVLVRELFFGADDDGVRGRCAEQHEAADGERVRALGDVGVRAGCRVALRCGAPACWSARRATRRDPIPRACAHSRVQARPSVNARSCAAPGTACRTGGGRRARRLSALRPSTLSPATATARPVPSRFTSEKEAREVPASEKRRLLFRLHASRVQSVKFVTPPHAVPSRIISL